MLSDRVDRASPPRRNARSPASHRTPSRLVLIAVNGIVAITAIGGGLALVLGLEQANYGPELLEGTPFSSYLWPGLILAIVVGGSAASATVESIRSTAAGGLLSMVAGAALIGWIVGEMILLEQPSEPTPVEILYLLAGFTMMAMGAFLWLAFRGHSRSSTPTDGGPK
jgi:hypothetical protein